MVLDDCLPTWILLPNSNVEGSIVLLARWIEECELACFSNVNCTGFDWNRTAPGNRRCWLSGPWSGRLNEGTVMGVNHYNIVRPIGCDGKYTSKPNFAFSLLYDVEIEASACVLSSRYAKPCYAML